MAFENKLGYINAMNVSLPKEQEEWLAAEVAAGHFSSIDEALTIAVAEFKALQGDDLVWAKPYVDEARAELARGEVISGDEFVRHLNERTRQLREKSQEAG